MDDYEVLPARKRWDPTSYAVACFLARYRDATLRAYRQDLLVFLNWCVERDLAPLLVERAHLELYLRWMEGRGYAAATISRRFGTVAGFFKYAVLDGTLPASPAVAVTRPRVVWESQRRTVLHPLEYAALLTAARHDGPSPHALVAMLGMLGLRISEACGADVERDQPAQLAAHLLHGRAAVGGAVAGHAVRHAALRQPHHAAVRHEPRQPRPARRSPRRGLPRRHGHRLTIRRGISGVSKVTCERLISGLA